MLLCLPPLVELHSRFMKDNVKPGSQNRVEPNVCSVGGRSLAACCGQLHYYPWDNPVVDVTSYLH